MLQHSPEQEEMRAFPGPLAKYVLTVSRNNFKAFRNYFFIACKLQDLNWLKIFVAFYLLK